MGTILRYAAASNRSLIHIDTHHRITQSSTIDTGTNAFKSRDLFMAIDQHALLNTNVHAKIRRGKKQVFVKYKLEWLRCCNATQPSGHNATQRGRSGAESALPSGNTVLVGIGIPKWLVLVQQQWDMRSFFCPSVSNSTSTKYQDMAIEDRIAGESKRIRRGY